MNANVVKTDVVPVDIDRRLYDIFYKLNSAQHFEFPHANCDVYTNESLATLYFKQSGYGSYCCDVIATAAGIICDLSALATNSQFVNHVTAWMRLKFTAEQVDPVRYAHYFERLPIPVNKTPKLRAELLVFYKADTTEFYAYVDRLANAIQMRWIAMMLGLDLDLDLDLDLNGIDLDTACTHINTEYTKIRQEIPDIDPYELPIKSFLEYQYRLRRIHLRQA